MIVESWMTKDPFTVTPEVTVRAAAAIMAEHRIRHLPVVRGERVVGMVTRSDLLRGEAVDPFSVGATEDRTPQREVRAVMASPVVTTLATTPLEDAADVMATSKFGALPVVRGTGALVGIISDADALRALISSLRLDGPCTRMVFARVDPNSLLAALAPKAKALGLTIAGVIPAGVDLVLTVRGPHGDRLADAAWAAGYRPISVIERQ